MVGRPRRRTSPDVPRDGVVRPPALTAVDGPIEHEPSDAVDTVDATDSAPAVVPDGLVDAALAGERPALEELIQTIHPLVVRYCRSRVSPDHRALAGADDVAQEVCLAVVSALPGYRRRSAPFLAFVYGIASHKVADVHRSSARNKSVPVPEIPDAVDDAVTPEQQAMRTATTSRMSELLQSLPAQQREILRLRVVVGLSADQTAEMLSTTPGAVRVAQHRALARLRAELTEAGERTVDHGGWAEVVG